MVEQFDLEDLRRFSEFPRDMQVGKEVCLTIITIVGRGGVGDDDKDPVWFTRPIAFLDLRPGGNGLLGPSYGRLVPAGNPR